MNLFTGKNFESNECIFDVHSFATELDEDTLRTKVNGGCCDASAPSAPPAPPAGNNPPSAPVVTATTPTTNPGTSPTTNTPNPSDPSNPGSGYTGGGYEPPPEVMSNPQAYGYWKALQALAEQQGDPDRYKDYNVLGYKYIEPGRELKNKNTQAYAYWRSLQGKAIDQGTPGKFENYNVLPDLKFPAPKQVTSVSEQGIAFIKEYEGFRSTPYKVNEKGKKTIGYGHEIKEGENFTSITEAEADALLRKDLEWLSQGITNNYSGQFTITQNEFDAMVSLEMNIGRSEFVRYSGVLDGIKENISQESMMGNFLTYRTSQGEYMKGLERRRYDELELFYFGDYTINRDLTFDKP